MTKKSKSNIISIILTAVILFGIFTVSDISNKTAYAYSQQDIQECMEAANYLNDNLADFIREYNASLSDEADRLTASYIEKTKLIRLAEENRFAVLIDFDGNNGYLVVNGDNEIYGLTTAGDPDDILYSEEVCYSHSDGLLYRDESGNLKKIGESDIRQNDLYNGQTGNGDGTIFNITNYVADRYPNYVLDKSVQNLSFDYYCGIQNDLSYYIKRYKNSDGTWSNIFTSEGNCALVAMYCVMRSWAQNYFIDVPYSAKVNVMTNITSDPLYNNYGRGIEHSSGGITYKWEIGNTAKLKFVPEVYTKLRAYAISNHNYNPETGYNAANVPATMQYVAAQYGETLQLSTSSLFSSAINALDNDKAVYMSMNGSSTYGNHAVVAIGYYRYRYQKTIAGFTTTAYAYFYEIGDGQNILPRFFDPNTSANPSLQFCYI